MPGREAKILCWAERLHPNTIFSQKYDENRQQNKQSCDSAANHGTNPTRDLEHDENDSVIMQ